MPRKDRTNHPIETLHELQRLVPSIVKEVNANDALALRAAANPLLAIEELGYELAPGLRIEAERRVRFPKAAIERLERLEQQVYERADERFAIDSPAELDRVLFEKLKLPRPDQRGTTKGSRKQPAATTPPTLVAEPAPHFARRPFVDPLEALRGAHPIMEPLLEYRKLEASEPRLAPRDLYERIRDGKVELPATRLRVRLKRGPTPE